LVNVNKLKGKIVENQTSVKELSDAIGVDESTFYRKLRSGGEPFTIGEADQIAKLLELTKDEATSIFFSQYVA
jgi:hypothetical protein